MPSRARLAAPAASGSILIHPPADTWASATQANRRLDDAPVVIGGCSLGDLRKTARREVLAAAFQYHSEFDEPFPSIQEDDPPLVLTGHQPELFHPGVWLKNPVAQRAAQAIGGVAVHIIMDHDVVKSTAIRVPVGKDHLLVGHVPFDRWESETPFEDRDVLDEAVFERFPDRLIDTMSKLSFEPICREYWRHVLAARSLTKRLGERLAYGRRQLERQWGAAPAEAPFGRLCRGAAFSRLLIDMLSRAQSLRREYNAALAEYRSRYGVRSKNHPASDLTLNGDWIETPFWFWTEDQPTRKPLFARIDGERCWIRGLSEPIDLDAHVEATSSSVAALKLSIRPRALIATLFLRLVAGDWFIHGIGGAKYDEVTDRLIERLYGITPPAFGVATGTLRLAGSFTELDGEVQEAKRYARDLIWNPDRYLDEKLRERPPLSELIEEKIEWAHTEPQSRREKIERFESLRRINNRLRPHVEVLRQHALERVQELQDRDRSQEILMSREYAFCLHSEESLRTFFASAQR